MKSEHYRHSAAEITHCYYFYIFANSFISFFIFCTKESCIDYKAINKYNSQLAIANYDGDSQKDSSLSFLPPPPPPDFYSQGIHGEAGQSYLKDDLTRRVPCLPYATNTDRNKVLQFSRLLLPKFIQTSEEQNCHNHQTFYYYDYICNNNYQALPKTSGHIT